MKKIYLTHCSAKKDDSLKNTRLAVSPRELYKASFIQLFIKRCLEKKVDWAIFSDRYGVWLPIEKHTWYDKPPSQVTEQEFKELVTNFDQKLKNYDVIYFYYHPGRFHSLYKRLLREAKSSSKIKMISHLSQIG